MFVYSTDCYLRYAEAALKDNNYKYYEMFMKLAYKAEENGGYCEYIKTVKSAV